MSDETGVLLLYGLGLPASAVIGWAIAAWMMRGRR